MANPTALLVTEFNTVKQSCTLVGVRFDDEAVADYFDWMVDRGLVPGEFGRCWLHTHPGDCPLPSLLDEETFGRVFGRCDWAVMFILAKGGDTYCRLRFNAGPGGEILLPVKVRWDLGFGHGTAQVEWLAEYKKNVTEEVRSLAASKTCDRGQSFEALLAEGDCEPGNGAVQTPADLADLPIGFDELPPDLDMERVGSLAELWDDDEEDDIHGH